MKGFILSSYNIAKEESDMDELQGKVALVTGASRGIGRAVAIAFAKAGANVAVNYRKSEGAAREVGSIIEDFGRRCVTVRADVSS